MWDSDRLKLCREALAANGSSLAGYFALSLATSFGQVDVVVETRRITMIYKGASFEVLHDGLFAESMINDFGFTEQHFAELMGVLQTEIDAFVQQHNLTGYINSVLAERAAKQAAVGLYKLLVANNVPFTHIEVRDDHTLCVHFESSAYLDRVPSEYDGVVVVTSSMYSTKRSKKTN